MLPQSWYFLVPAVRPCPSVLAQLHCTRALGVFPGASDGSLAAAAPAIRLTPSRALAVAGGPFCGKWRGGKAPQETDREEKPQRHATMIGSFLLASGSRLNAGG